MVGLADDLDDVFVGTLTSWIDQYHHFWKLPMRWTCLRFFQITRDLGLTLIRIQGTGTAMFFCLGEYWVFFHGNLSHRKPNQAKRIEFSNIPEKCLLDAVVWSNKSGKAVKQLINSWTPTPLAWEVLHPSQPGESDIARYQGKWVHSRTNP